MDCPKCLSVIDEGDEYCRRCGARLEAETPRSEAPPPPQPPDASSSGSPALKVTAALLVVAALAALTVLALTLVRPDPNDTTTSEEATSTAEARAIRGTTQPTATVPSAPSDTEVQVPVGYPTAEEALVAYLPVDISYKKLWDYGPQVEYATAPPESDYTQVVIVERQADGSWKVVGTRALEPGEAGPNITDDAEALVTNYVHAIAGGGDEDLAFTVNGDDEWAGVMGIWAPLLHLRILTTVVEDDGTTVTVNTLEVWQTLMWETAYFRSYTCVPTADGYRVLRSETLLSRDAEGLWPGRD